MEEFSQPSPPAYPRTTPPWPHMPLENSSTQPSTVESVLPSPVYSFIDMFDGRDENGNELPPEEVGSAGRSRSASPMQDRGLYGYGRTRSPSPPSPSRHGMLHEETAACLPALHDEYVAGSASPHGSSLSEAASTPVRDFFEMFSDSETLDEPEYEPSQV